MRDNVERLPKAKARRNRLLGPGHVAAVFRESILAGTLAEGARLPSVRDISRKYDVSTRTSLAGLRILEKEGLVERAPRSGIFVKGKSSTIAKRLAERVESRKTKAEEIAEDLIAAISRGEYQAGDYLPIRKALQFNYATSSRTIGHALEIVRRRELITRKGSSYMVGSETIHKRARNARVQIIGQPTRESGVIGQVHSRKFLRGFDGELAKHGTVIHRQIPSLRNGEKLNRETAVLGYLRPATHYWIHTAIGNSEQNLRRELGKLARLKLPTVIFDVWELPFQFPAFSFKPYPSLFPITSERRRGGEEVARFLAARGHTRIAYFSYSTEVWNTERLQGVKLGFEKTLGKRGNVETFAANFEKGNLHGFAKGGIPHADEIADQTIANLFAGYRFDHTTAFEVIVNQVFPAITVDHHHRTLKPFFEKALKKKGISAWICADPTVAEAANAFLSEKKTSIPGQLSLAVIDDNYRTLQMRITAYDRQVERLGYLAAHCLLGDIPIRKDSKGIVECPGRIIDRGSVGRM